MPENLYGQPYVQKEQEVQIPSINQGGSNAFQSSEGRLETSDERYNRILKQTSPQGFTATPKRASEVSSDLTGRYDTVVYGANNEDAWAAKQSGFDRVVNGTLKGVGLFATTFVGGTTGILWGTGKALLPGGKFSDVWKNEVTENLDKINKEIDNKYLPNYESDKEKNASPIIDSAWWTWNLLGNKLIKNAGFAVGAIYSGNLFGKVLGAAGKGIGSMFNSAAEYSQAWKGFAGFNQNLARLFSRGANEEAYLLASKNVSNLADFEAQSSALANAASKFTKINNFQDIGQRLAMSTYSAGGESAFEGIGNYNAFKDKRIQEYKDKWGFAPTGEELKKIEEQATNVGNVSFALNMAILSGTEFVQLPYLIGSSYKNNRAAANAFMETQGIAQNAAGKWIKKEATSKFGKVANFIKEKGAYVFAPSEMIEELLQNATQVGTDNYYNKAYKGEEASNFADGFASMLGSAYEGAKQTLTTKEGLEAGILGGVSGGLMQIKSTFLNNRNQNVRRNELINSLNLPDNTFTNALNDRINSFQRGIKLQEDGEQASVQGDKLEFLDNKHDRQFNYLYTRIKHGRLDLVKEDISERMQQAATEQGYKQMQANGFAPTNLSREDYVSSLVEFQNHAERTAKILEANQLAYSGKVNQEGKRLYSDEVIEKLSYAASKVADYDVRIPQISSELLSHGIDVQSVLERELTNPIGLEKELKQIEEDFPIQADKLKQDLVDLVELSQRRKLFIEEYKNIKSSPENFNTAPKPTSTSEPVPNDTKTITLKTKDGEEQLEVNESYVAGSKEIKTKEGNTIPAFLKFTLLGEDKDGNVLIKTKEGQTHTISKSAFEDYKLGKLSNLSKAQRFFVENSKRIFNFQMKGGKSIPGSIVYDKNERKLYFEGQGKRIPLNNDLSQFSPQSGYNRAQIWTEGEYSQETQDAVNAPLSQEEINDQKNIEGKIAERRNILRQAKQQIQEKVNRVNNKLVAKKEQLKNLEQEVEDLLQLRKKNKYDNTTKITNFNKVVNTSIKGLARLSTLKTELENEIADLEQLKAELAFDISYFEDFEQNLEELPTSLKEFRNELKSQIKGLEDITVSIGEDINSFTKMIATIKDVIKDFASLLKSAISKINSDYPSYIKDSFDRIIAGNDYMAEANSLKEYISDLKFAEDTEKEIKLNEDKVNEVSNKIQSLYEQLEEVENEQRAKQKILDAFEVVIQRELAKKAEEAKVANNKELQNKLEQQQKDSDNQSGVSNTEEPQEEFTYSKADLTTFLSKEADFYDTSAEKLEPLEEVKINRSHQKRRLNFLNYLARVFDTKANDYKVLAISRSNEETYGLKGLIDYMLSESKDKLDKDPIVKLYVKKEGNKLFIIDKEGKNIKELSQEDSLPNLVENGVFGVFHDEIGEYKKGSKAGEKNFSGEYSEEDLTKVKQQFEDWKTRVNQSTESIIYDIQGISRGISLRDGENKSVFKTGLITKVDLEQTNLIQVPSKEGSITTKDGVSLKLPLGQPVLVKGGNIELLNNRQFTPQESKSIFSVLKQYVKLSNEQNNEAKKLGTYLRGILYFSTPKEGKPVTKGQIYFSKGNLHFGEEITIPFTESSVQANESRILEFLENTYNNTNSHYLTSPDYHNQPFFSYDENLKEVKHENYQAFLLLGDNPFLQTTLRPLDNNRPNIISRYTILSHNSEFDYKVAPKQQQIAEPVKQDSELTIEQVEGLRIKNVKSGKETNLTLNGVKITSEPGFLKDGMNTITLDRLNKNLKDGIYTIVSGSKPIIPTSSQQYTLENVNGVTFKNSKGIQGTVSIENGMIILPIFKGGRTVTNLNEINSLAERGLLTVISDEVEQPFQEEIQQEQQEESEFEKAKKAAKNAPIDREEYKLAEEFTNYKQEDVIKFLQYVKDKTPFNVQLLNQILKTPNGINAWGSYKDMVIRLYNAALEGTGYHEIFEGVYKVFLSTKEKENIYKEFKERKGNFTFFDGEQYSSIPYSEATQFQMKETLADEFSEFVLKPHEPQSLISKWFNNLWNFIKSILSGRVTTIEDVFKKIDTGQYKSPATRNISTEEAEEFKLADLQYIQQHEVVRGVAIDIIQTICRDGHSLSEFEESELPIEDYFKETFNKLNRYYTTTMFQTVDNEDLQKAYFNLWGSIKQDWDNVKELVKEQLKTIAIVEAKGKNDEIEYNKEYIGDKYYWQNDAKNTASRSIKLLFLTTPESVFTDKISTNGRPEVISRRTTATLLQEQINYSKEFNAMLLQMTEVNSYEDKFKLLSEIAKKNPNFERINQRLITPSKVGNQLNDWKLKIRWYNVMSKQNPTAYIQYNDGKGGSDTGTANLESSKKLLVQNWIDGMKQKSFTPNKVFKVVNDEFVLNTKELKFEISKPQDKINFLSQLGIDFNIEDYNRLSTKDQKTFNDGVTGLASQLKKKPNYPIENSRSIESVKNLEQIAEAALKAGKEFNSMYPNLEGEQQSQFTGTNAISRTSNDLNNSRTKEQLFEVQPQLEQVKDSLYLNKLLYNSQGEKTALNLEVGFIQGTLSADGKPIPGDKLTPHQRLLQEINQNLSGRYYTLVPADSTTQWLLNMTNPIPFSQVEGNQYDVNQLISTYYETEKAAYEELKNVNTPKLDKRAGIFKELSENYTLSPEQVVKNFEKFLEQTTKDQFEFLTKFKVIQERDGEYKINGLDNNFRNKNFGKTISKQDVLNMLKFRTLNYAINNIEIQKLYFGNILEYSDPTKRYKLFMSPREASMYGVQDYNNYLNETQNEGLINGRLGKFIHSDFQTTATMQDVGNFNETLSKMSPGYENSNSTDAQAYSTLPGFKARRLKEGNWTEAFEEQYQYNLALDRQLMLEDGELTNKDYPTSLQQQDKKLIEKGNPNSAFFYVEKPIVSGFVQQDGKYNPLVDKFSIASFSYSTIRNTNFRKHYLKMLDQNIGYIIQESGRKVGARTLNNYYNEDGTINETPFQDLINVPYSAFGVQTDTSSLKESQTRGTQITKLAIVNLFEDGNPISEKAGELARKNIDLLKEQVEIGYANLLNTFGAEDTEGGFKILDKSKIVELLKKEMLRREMPENIKQLLDVNDEKQLVTAFEAFPNYIQIKNILYSYVDKNITSPKVSGAPQVQISGALMEKYGVKRVSHKGKEVFVSAGLHMYTKEEPWIEVLMPFHAAKTLRNAGLKWNSPEELYKLIKESPDAKQILSAIGFRIPTQELNSIENIRIAGFLPEEMGNSIVVPEEITTKAGSDFDIDKLNTYLKNIYVDAKGVIRIIPYGKTKEEYEDIYYTDILQSKIDRKEAKKLSTSNLQKLFGDIATGQTTNKVYEKWVPIFKSKFEDELVDGKLPVDTIEQFFINRLQKLQIDLNELTDFNIQQVLADEFIQDSIKQGIENEYFTNIQNILELPENFERLITPNNDKDLKGIRDQLVELAPNEFLPSGEKSIINPMYMLAVRHEGLVTKGLVGIAAVAQTGIAVRQLSDIYIDPSKAINLSFTKNKYFRDGKVYLPHNRNEEGFISLSKIKDKEGRYITDKNSQYINGTVDVFKDAYLAQINFNRRTAGVNLFMENIGIPNSKELPIVGMFINQPIIRDLINEININESNPNTLFSKKSIETVQKKYKSNFKLIEQMQTKFGELSQKGEYEVILKQLKSAIKAKYSGEEFSEEQKAMQMFVLNEFLKYAVMAEQLFGFQQGTNWDTSTFNDNNSVYFKNAQLENSRKSIISSADTLLNSTFIGEQRKAIIDSTEVLNDVLLTENPIVQKYLNKIKERISKSYKSLDDKNTIARKAEESLLSYLIQTSTGLNTVLEKNLISTETALINELKRLKTTLKNNPDIIGGNIILNNLIPSIKGKKQGATKNIKLAIQPRDVFSKNIYADAFEELLRNPITEKFAQNLVRLHFLQNGIASSPISLKDIIPARIFAQVVNKGIEKIENEDVLNSFIETGSFYKNNVNNDLIVKDVTNDSYLDVNVNDNILNYLDQVLPNEQKPLILFVDAFKGDFSSPFVTHSDYGNEFDIDALTTKRLFKRVENSFGEPITLKKVFQDPLTRLKEKKTVNVYVQTNALGDGFRAQEYYDNNRPSVFQNGFEKTNEIDSTELGDFLTNPNMQISGKNMNEEQYFEDNNVIPYYEGNIKPDNNTIFVFGSNPEGRHGAGAAKIAVEQFKAIYKKGRGLQGNSFGLVTKNLTKGFKEPSTGIVYDKEGEKSVSPEQIITNIKELYEVAQNNPNKEFKIGYRNTTKKSLNGYTGLEMINMFNKAGKRPSNIIFSKEWVDTGTISQTLIPNEFPNKQLKLPTKSKCK